MKKLIILFVAMTTLAGCSSDSGSSETVSPYKGQWQGTMTNNHQTVPETGNAQVNLQIDKYGTIVASYNMVNLGGYFAQGTITDNGVFSLLPDNDTSHSTIYTMVFNATLVSQYLISGTWSDSSRNWTGTFVFDKVN